MSTDCCTYGCTRDDNCPAGSVTAEKPLAGVDLRAVKVDDAYTDLMARQWLATWPTLTQILERIFN